MIPTSYDALVKDSRVRIKRLRKQFPDPEDFQRKVCLVLRVCLEEQGCSPKAVAFTMAAIFGKD